MATIKVPAIFTAIDKFSAPLQKMSAEVNAFQASMARYERKWRHLGDSAIRFGRNSAIATALIAAPLIIATKAAVDFEDKMADVAKTTGMEGSALEGFGDSILEMASKTRTSIDDLLKIGEIGGQLGVAKDQLLAFTETANQFNVALGGDFSGGVEEAVASVSKLKSLFTETRSMDIADVIRKSGSAINSLGAEGNGTSSNITDFALSIGALPDAMKPSIESTLALGTYLEELGVESKRGSSGVAIFIATAGKDINSFAKSMNMSADAAREMFGKDSLGFMAKFAEQFKGMEFDELSTELEKFGLNSVEVKKVVGALSNDSVDLTTGMSRLQELQALANKSFKEGTSLMDEYNTKNSTAAAKWEIMKNNISAATIAIGQAFLPVLLDLMQGITPMIKKFSEWSKQNKGLLATITKTVGAFAGLTGLVSIGSFAFGGIAKTIAFAAKTMAWYKSGTLSATIATKIFNTTLMGMPLMWVVAGVVAVSAAVYGLIKAFNKKSAAEQVNAEIQERVLENTLDERVELLRLTNTMRTHNQTSDAYIAALNKIEQMQPGITDKYNLQEKSVKAISAAERELTENILKRAEMEVRAEMLKEEMRKNLEMRDEKRLLGMESKGFFGLSAMVDEANLTGSISESDQKLKVLSEGVTQDELGTVNPGWERQMALTNSGEAFKKQQQKIEITVKGDGTFGVKQSGDEIGSVNSLMPTTSSTR